LLADPGADNGAMSYDSHGIVRDVGHQAFDRTTESVPGSGDGFVSPYQFVGIAKTFEHELIPFDITGLRDVVSIVLAKVVVGN
jgi:hypothetical protein